MGSPNYPSFNYRSYTGIVLTAGATFRIEGLVDYVKCRSHSLTTDTTEISFLPHSGKGGIIRAGTELFSRSGPADGILLRNTSASSCTIALDVGYGVEIRDIIMAAAVTITGTAAVNPTVGSHADIADFTVNAGATTTILAAGTTRRSALIGSLRSNAGVVRIGTTPTASRGAELAPGEKVIIPGATLIAVHNPLAVATLFTINTHTQG